MKMEMNLFMINEALIEQIIQQHEEPNGYEQCISLLLQASPQLAVKILKQPEMEPILYGAFYQG